MNVLALALQLAVTTNPPPTLAPDKATYTPRDMVALSGTSFMPVETVPLRVTPTGTNR